MQIPNRGWTIQDDDEEEEITEPRSFHVGGAMELGEPQPPQHKRKGRGVCPCRREPQVAAAAAPLASPAVGSQTRQAGCCAPGPKRKLPDHSSNPFEQRPPIEILQQLQEDWGCESSVTRMRDVWEYPGVGGKVRLRLGGLIVTGPPHVDTKFSICAWTSILSPTAFFFLVCGRDLWITYPYIPVGGAICLVLMVFMAMLTMFTDPGIIPRPALQLLIPGLQEEVAKAIGLEGKPGGRREDIIASVANPYIMAEIEPLGYWWCRWCHMIQPPRAKHCRDCDCCVLVEDHHCPFLNNCIGHRNYGFFYSFVTALIFLGGFVVFGTFTWMATEYNWGYPINSQQETAAHHIIAFLGWFVIIIPGLLLVAITIFALFHLQLIIRGRTTREVLTGRFVAEATSTLFARRGRSLLKVWDRIQFPPEVKQA